MPLLANQKILIEAHIIEVLNLKDHRTPELFPLKKFWLLTLCVSSKQEL